jgi:hypothetical protein
MSNDDTTRIIARKSSAIDELQETVSLSRNISSASTQDDDSHTKGKKHHYKHHHNKQINQW